MLTLHVFSRSSVPFVIVGLHSAESRRGVMLLLEAMGTWYREGGGRHCTGMVAEVKIWGMAREIGCHLWLFLAQMGRWESGRVQGTEILALRVADWTLW